MKNSRKSLTTGGRPPVRLLSLLTLLFTLTNLTEAANQIENDLGCASCVANGSVVCRPNYYDRYSFCCDETEIGTRTCGGQDVFCTTMSQNALMNAFACPYSYGYCGAKTSEIVMHPTNRNNIAIEISNRLFVNEETCYYQFSVPTTDLDSENMRYFWDVEIKELTNVVITINNGTALDTAADPITVSFSTGYRFQFTAENNIIFMTFTGSVPSTSSTDPLFSMTIKLRSFALNPSSGEEEKEETDGGTDSNENEGDGSEEEEKEEDKPLIPDQGEIDGDTEEIEVVTETEIVTQTVLVPNKNTIGEKSKTQTRKDQVGLHVLSAATVLAVVIYCSIAVCSKCIKKRHERQQIKTMNSFNTIEVSANPNQHASEQHGLMRRDSKFFQTDPIEHLENDMAASKKMRIADAIENQDDGTKKPASKKKKKKGYKKAKDADINMLNVEQVDQEDSYNSARGHAQHIDLSNAMPDTPSGVQGSKGGSNTRQPRHNNTMPPINDTPHGLQYHGLSQNASHQQLSVHDELAQIDEAADLSHHGSRENLHQQHSSRADLQRNSQNFSSHANLHQSSHNQLHIQDNGANQFMPSQQQIMTTDGNINLRNSYQQAHGSGHGSHSHHSSAKIL